MRIQTGHARSRSHDHPLLPVTFSRASETIAERRREGGYSVVETWLCTGHLLSGLGSIYRHTVSLPGHVMLVMGI